MKTIIAIKKSAALITVGLSPQHQLSTEAKDEKFQSDLRQKTHVVECVD